MTTYLLITHLGLRQSIDKVPRHSDYAYVTHVPENHSDLLLSQLLSAVKLVKATGTSMDVVVTVTAQLSNAKVKRELGSLGAIIVESKIFTLSQHKRGPPSRFRENMWLFDITKYRRLFYFDPTINLVGPSFP